MAAGFRVPSVVRFKRATKPEDFMTVNELIKKLQRYNKDIRNKHIQIQAPNGILMNPEIKLVLKDRYAGALVPENIDYVIITS